jgi:hypothetical protein
LFVDIFHFKILHFFRSLPVSNINKWSEIWQNVENCRQQTANGLQMINVKFFLSLIKKNKNFPSHIQLHTEQQRWCDLRVWVTKIIVIIIHMYRNHSFRCSMKIYIVSAAWKNNINEKIMIMSIPAKHCHIFLSFIYFFFCNFPLITQPTIMKKNNIFLPSYDNRKYRQQQR